MLLPRKNEFDLWEDMFKDPFFSRKESQLMKTDIVEKDKEFIITMDLPGYSKENIQIEIENGYLTIHATTKNEEEEQESGKLVRKERYFGECSRSFYIGEDLETEDINAKFSNGTLKLYVPKKEEEAKPEKKYVEIKD